MKKVDWEVYGEFTPRSIHDALTQVIMITFKKVFHKIAVALRFTHNQNNTIRQRYET